jgi:hypothetical protein
MESLREIHEIARAELLRRFSIKPFPLRHPFPERPIRTLGLLKFDGDVYTSEKFARVVMMRVSPPFNIIATSTFIRPRMELGMPFFDAEVVIFGKRRMFMVDLQSPGGSAGYDGDALINRLIAIRDRYPDLLKKTLKMKGEIQNVFSKAACQVIIKDDLEHQAMSIFREYFNVYLEMLKTAEPLAGDALEEARQAFEIYSSHVIKHDPGVKAFTLFFGKEGGMERANDIFFNN